MAFCVLVIPRLIKKGIKLHPFDRAICRYYWLRFWAETIVTFNNAEIFNALWGKSICANNFFFLVSVPSNILKIVFESSITFINQHNHRAFASSMHNHSMSSRLVDKNFRARDNSLIVLSDRCHLRHLRSTIELASYIFTISSLINSRNWL